MPNEAIDPAEVVLDLSTPKSEPPPEEIDPAKVKIDPYFSPTKKQFSRIREAFTSDPLAVVEDEGDRARLELESSRMPDPENFRKRYALAAYYSQMQNSDFKFVLANLDQFTAKYNNGKPQTVEAAYHDIAANLAPQQKGELAQHGHSLLSGLARIPATLWNLHAKASRWGLDLQTEILKPLMSEEDYRWNKDYARLSEDIQRGVARNYEEISAEEAKKSGANPEFVTDLLAGRFDQVSPYDFTKALLQSAPDMSLQLLIGMANPWAVPAYVTATSGVNKAYELEENHPEIQGTAKYTNIGVTAVTQGLLDLVTARIMGGGFSKEQAAEAVKKGLLKYLGKSFAEEAATESAQQLGENLTDLFTGVYGDIGGMSLDEKMGHIFRGVPESGFVGGMYGPVFGYRGYRNLKAMDQYRMQVRTRLEAERERILQKDALTSVDMATLARINEKLDAGNLNDLASVEFETEFRQEIEGQQEEKPEVQATPEFREVERTAWDGATEEDIQQAVEAGKHQRLLQKLPHNPQDTADAANDLMAALFPAFRLDIVNTTGELAPEVRARIEAEGIDPAHVRAWVDDSDTVHLIAENVRPSDVARTIGHEVIGHKGLRAVFGEQFDNLLDLVYRDHFEEVAKLAETYHRDTETIENRRYLTEEFLADCASAEMKPKWWKELLQQIKMGLRKIPGLQNLRFTDRDIEGALMRSARAMRRRDAENRSLGQSLRLLADDPESGKAFPKRHAGNYSEALNNLRSLQGQTFVNADTGIEARLSANGVNKLLSNKAREKSNANGFTNEEHFEAAANIDRLFENAVLTETREDRKGSEHIISIKRFSAPFYTGKEFAEAYITAKESIQHGHRIYSLELEEIKKPSTVNQGGRPDRHPRPADGTPSDADAEWTKHNPTTESYNSKLLEKIEKSRQLLEKEGKKNDSDIKFSVKEASQELEQAIQQKFRSGNTSLRQVAAGFKKIDFEAGTVNLDLGGGKYDEGTRYLAEKGVKNLVFDPVNRDSAHNRAIFEAVKNGEVDTVTCNNVLNVIGEAAARDNVILQAAKALRPDGTAYFTVYEGDGSGNGRQSQADSWQEHRKTTDYLDEVKKHFADVSIKNKVITARKPITAGKLSAWFMDGGFENPIRFSIAPPPDSPEFKRWFGKSQMVDKDGKPRVFYHGTNRNFYTFKADAPQAHDRGFYGKGFYFDFWEGEAGYYGNRVIPVYLRVENPFDFEDMLTYKGGRVHYVGADSLCFLYNIAQKFPELEGKIAMPSKGEWINDELVTEAPLSFKEYIDLVEDTEKRLSIVDVHDRDRIEKHVHFDTQEFYEWNGKKRPEIRTIMRDVLRNDTPESRREILAASTFTALKEIYNIDSEYHPEGIMTRNPEITEAIKQHGHDGIIQSRDGDEVIVFSPTQIKSATENNGAYDPQNPDIRYSLSEYSEADRNDIIAMLKPYAGIVLDRDGADYAKYLAAKGVDIPAEDARIFALEATRENMKTARERAAKRRNDWLFENVPVWRDVVEAIGSENFKIVPSLRFRDEEMSGTFIAKKKETGMPSDELAQAIARRTGRDPLDIEQEVMDFFRDLKKPDLYKMYSDWKKENVLGDREAEKQMRAEWEKQEQARVEDEVIQLLERGTPVTAEWAAENRDVYRELYRQLFGGKEPPQNPGKADLEAMNAAIRQEGGNAATFAQAYRTAREKAYEEFAGKLRGFKDRVLAAKADAMKLQRDALSFAEKHLPKENRGEFARAIVKLMEVPSSPSAKYPEGRRAAEFRKIFEDILNRGAEVRKEGAIAEIREMLDAAKIKRNYKGIPTSVLPSEQAHVDRIRKIVSLDLPAVANMIDFNNEQLSALDADAEGNHKAEALLEDNLLLTTFGNLDYQAPDKVEAAAKQLRELISGGKAAFAEKLAERKAYLDGLRKRMVEDATFGKNSFADRGDARKHSDFMLKNESLGTLMRIASGRGIQEFDSTVGGELYRRIEDATQAEQTQLRRMQADLDKALRDIAGVDSMRKKGQFFRLLSEVAEHSGVHKTEYTRPIQTGKHDYVFEEGRRQLVSKSIPIEDYEFEGKPRKGVRSLLRDIDNGKPVKTWAGIPLDETAVAFLRQQVADFDAGLKQSYEIFNDESDDANFNRMLEEERSGGRAVIFGHNPEEISRTVEVPLSQGAALQILLTWEQEHYRPNMKWNGWTEKSMEELRAFLKPEVLQMGYWMRGEIAANKAALDAKVFDRYGAHLPENDNYFPAAFRGGRSRAVRPESELGRGAGSLSINPNFLIARKFHLKPVDIDADAFSSFLGNQIEQHHFLAWADALRDLKSVYGSAMVQKAINDNFGRNVSDNLVERIETIARGGGRFSGDYAARLLGRLYRHWVPAKIALNPSSAIKQMFGTAAYMNHIPVTDFCRGLAQANFTNPEFREFVKFARNTDYMKNRLSGGLDKDLQYLMNYTRDSKAYSPISDTLLQVGTWQTRWSDAWSTLHGGFAVYKYNLEQAKKAGMTGPEAHDAAIRAWMRSTDETQQSGYLKDLNYFQSNQGAYRYLTAFLTNPIQVMNLQLQTINELRYGTDRKTAARKLAKQLFVNHLVIPSLMLFTSDMLRAGFNAADWWDETEFEDYLLAWCLGQYEAVFLFGKLASNIGGYALKKAAGHNAYGSDVLSALPLADDLQRDIDLAARMMKQGELTESDLFGALKALGDIGMAAGMADSRAGSVGAVLSAIGTQGKRVMKWISGK